MLDTGKETDLPNDVLVLFVLVVVILLKRCHSFCFLFSVDVGSVECGATEAGV